VSDLRAPFPWFGGKRKVAPHVWAALGDVDNYVEPFAGSLAVLLGRPDRHSGSTETVNDKDGFVANFWRALAADPDAVAGFADWPVNEADLHARHLWLVTQADDLLIRLMSDPEWFDAKVAGWWVWGICSWIGSGWCDGNGPWMLDADGRIANRSDSSSRQGVNRQRPHLGGSGQGVNRSTNSDLVGYFAGLANRLRDVRVCCGDWSRVVTTGALTYGATVGVFLDPPYLGDVRDKNIYAVDDHIIAHDVREWAVANGDNPRLRIVLAGYVPEHDHLVPESWRRMRWSAGTAYGTAASAKSAGGNADNRHLECLWMSPHCVDIASADQLEMFDDGAA
jgi:hypothetical protein